jgi:hypothetical protein
MTTVHGQIDAGLTLEALGAALTAGGLAPEARRSAHSTGGRYVRLRSEGAELSFERVSDAEILVLGDSEGHAPLRALAWAASRALAAAGLRHRLEVYEEEDDRLAAYLHHGWPAARLWIGHEASEAAAAAELAAVAEGLGVEVERARLARLPMPGPGDDGLAALHARVLAAHDGLVWLLHAGDGRADLIEREARIAARRAGRGLGLGRSDGRGPESAEASTLAPAVAILGPALPGLTLERRPLLVIEDRFALEGRGLVLAPELPLSALPAGPGHALRLGLARPDGRLGRLEARAEIPFVSPPRPSGPAWVLRVPGASKAEVPIGSLVWLDSDL